MVQKVKYTMDDLFEQMKRENEEAERFLQWKAAQHREEMAQKYDTGKLLENFCEELGRYEEAMQDFIRKHGKH